MSNSGIYSAILANPTKINIIDVTSGRVLNSISITGKLINGPIVVGDKCTIVVDSNGSRKSNIYSLPVGRLLQTYQV